MNSINHQNLSSILVHWLFQLVVFVLGLAGYIDKLEECVEARLR